MPFTKNFKIHLVSLQMIGMAGMGGFLSSPAFASRAAVVDAASAEVYAFPMSSAPVLARLPKTSVVVSSNLPTDGYYKVRVGDNMVGWIKVENLSFAPAVDSDAHGRKLASKEDGSDSEGDAEDDSESSGGTGKSKRERALERRALADPLSEKIRARGFGGVGIFSSGASPLNGITTLGLNFHYGGELVFWLADRFGIVVRAEQVFKQFSLTDLVTAKNFSVKLSSVPVVAGFEVDLVRRAAVFISISAMAGVGMQTQVSSVNNSDTAPPPNSSVAGGMPMVVVGKINLGWRLNRVLAFSVDAGYRSYFSTAQSVTAVDSNGTLVNSGALVFKPSFVLDYSSPFVGAGLTLTF